MRVLCADIILWNELMDFIQLVNESKETAESLGRYFDNNGYMLAPNFDWSQVSRGLRLGYKLYARQASPTMFYLVAA